MAQLHQTCPESSSIVAPPAGSFLLAYRVLVMADVWFKNRKIKKINKRKIGKHEAKKNRSSGSS